MNEDAIKRELEGLYSHLSINVYQIKPTLQIYSIYIKLKSDSCLEFYYNSYRNYVKIYGLSKCGDVTGSSMLHKLKSFVNKHYITSGKLDDMIKSIDDSEIVNNIISIDNYALNAITILEDHSYIYVTCGDKSPIPVDLYNLFCLSRGMSWYNSLGFGEASPTLLEYISTTPYNNTNKTIKETFSQIGNELKYNGGKLCDYNKLVSYSKLINNFSFPFNVEMPSKRNLTWYADAPPVGGGRARRHSRKSLRRSRSRHRQRNKTN